ncbi:hypothetical protein LIER_02655 [Lithospermum erythrorhizon]|uniref:Reverse transcriptase domain-containing protein n=1 Tax=Lithospermum erythrorhizon TaxID=34254 RepID=A0AAV3NU43_LITER
MVFREQLIAHEAMGGGIELREKELEGDMNTSFFHNSATQRQKSNRIEGIMDKEGNWQEEPVDKHLTEEMKRSMDKPYDAEEVKKVVVGMSGMKAPGPDGVVFRKFGYTHIVLIPKFIAKYIANRLKAIMPQLISNTQSAFVSDRFITDNVLLAYEVHHSLKRKKGQVGCFSLKLDMQKAYDRVEWDFLRVVMVKMQFPDNFIKLMHAYISTVSYSVMVNGDQCGYFKSSRGLRQGDPFSPYLFLLCTERFIHLIREATSNGSLQGVQVGRSGPRLTHLLFVDDSLLFRQASVEECGAIKTILRRYEESSGQAVNYSKSTVWFSPNVQGESKRAMLDILGVSERGVRGKVDGWQTKSLSKAGKQVMIKAVLQAIPPYAIQCFKLPTTLCHELEALFVKFWSKQNALFWCIGTPSRPRGLDALSMPTVLTAQKWSSTSTGIAKDPQSTLNIVYKSKYFPDSSFWDANLGSNPSYIWRSIISSRDILRKGCKWKVGNGENMARFLGH